MSNLPHPPFCRQHGAFDIDAVRLPPLFDGHVAEGGMVRQNAKVEGSEGDAALDDAEIAAGGFKGAGELFFGGDVDVVVFVVDVLDGMFGFCEVKDGDVGSGCEESFYLGTDQ